MGTGYVRNDTANNIADGNVINASDLDGEFDAIQAAFNATTGHSHDGTTGEGPQIGTGGIADLAVTTGKIANDAVTLGTKTSGNYVATGAVSGVGLSGSASAEGATFTVTSNATDANTASTIVARDASGNFSAGTITAALTGTASNAALLDSLDSTQFLRSDAADTKTSGDLSFADNVKAQFGAGNDLQIYHDASNSYITDAGTGSLRINGNNLELSNANYTANYLVANNGANVQLYYNGDVKITTAATGIDVTGTITFDGGTTSADLNFGDNDKATFGAGSDLQVYHSSADNHSYIVENNASGSLFIKGTHIYLQNSTGQDALNLINGDAYLKSGGSTVMQTTSGGIDVTGSLTADGLTVDGDATIQNTGTPTLTLSDSDGTNQHLRFRHNGNESYIDSRNNTGYGNLFLGRTNGTSNLPAVKISSGGDVLLYADDGTTQGFFWDASTQRLGLGTTAPSSIFHTEENTTGASIVRHKNTSNTSGAHSRLIIQNGGTSGGDALINLDTQASGSRFTLGVDRSANKFVIANADKGSFDGSDEAMVITSGGNVGIGTTSPDRALHVNTSQDYVAKFSSSDAGAAILLEDSNSTANYNRIGVITHDMQFVTNNAEAMRIDSSQNLLVGKTTASSADNGVFLSENSGSYFTRDGGYAGLFNRRTSDGEVIQIRKDNSTVGQINTVGGNSMAAGSNDVGVKFQHVSPYKAVIPFNPSTNANSDAAIDLGIGTVRYKDLYLSGGVYAGSGFGSSGQLLTSNGTTATWQDAPAGGAGYFQGENGVTGDATNGLGDIFRVHEDTLNTNVTIASGNNALCAGPLTIATGVTLTVNGNLSIV